MQITGILHPHEHSAYEILMRHVPFNGDYSYAIFDSKKRTFEATTGYVMLEVKSQEDFRQFPEITDFMFKQMPDEEAVPLGENVHIPRGYLNMLNGIGYIKVHYVHHKLTNELVPGKLEMSDYDGQRTIWIEDYKLGYTNYVFIKKPAMDKNLFGVGAAPSFMLYKYKRTFDQVLEKLNKECPYQIKEDQTFAMGSTERGYDFYLVTKTPLSLMS